MISTKRNSLFWDTVTFLIFWKPKTGKILNFPGCLNLSEHKVERKSRTIEQNWRWCYSSMVFKGRIDIRMQWMTGNGLTGHLRVCQHDARLLQKSAAHEFVCLCACMSVYAFGRGYRDTFLEFPRLSSHLHHPLPPTSLSVLPVSVCGDQVFVIIVSASFGGGAVLAVIRVLAVLGPTPSSFFLRWVVQSQVHHGSASRPGTGAAGSCRGASRSRLPGLVCAAMCWRVAIRLRNTLVESKDPLDI